jgi:hypothetical protein
MKLSELRQLFREEPPLPSEPPPLPPQPSPALYCIDISPNGVLPWPGAMDRAAALERARRSSPPSKAGKAILYGYDEAADWNTKIRKPRCKCGWDGTNGTCLCPVAPSTPTSQQLPQLLFERGELLGSLDDELVKYLLRTVDPDRLDRGS